MPSHTIKVGRVNRVWYRIGDGMSLANRYMPSVNLSSRSALINYLGYSFNIRVVGGDYDAEVPSGGNSSTISSGLLEGSTTTRQFHSGPWLFCFNVKVPTGIDDTLPNLVRVYRQSAEHFNPSPGWLTAAQAVLDDQREQIWEITLEQTRVRFINGLQSYVSPIYNEVIPKILSYGGRSGGWLILSSFNGHPLTESNWFDIRQWHIEDLRKLVEFVYYLFQQTARSNITRILTEAFADMLVNNYSFEIDSLNLERIPTGDSGRISDHDAAILRQIADNLGRAAFVEGRSTPVRNGDFSNVEELNQVTVDKNKPITRDKIGNRFVRKIGTGFNKEDVWATDQSGEH